MAQAKGRFSRFYDLSHESCSFLRATETKATKTAFTLTKTSKCSRKHLKEVRVAYSGSRICRGRNLYQRLYAEAFTARIRKPFYMANVADRLIFNGSASSSSYKSWRPSHQPHFYDFDKEQGSLLCLDRRGASPVLSIDTTGVFIKPVLDRDFGNLGVTRNRDCGGCTSFKIQAVRVAGHSVWSNVQADSDRFTPTRFVHQSFSRYRVARQVLDCQR